MFRRTCYIFFRFRFFSFCLWSIAVFVSICIFNILLYPKKVRYMNWNFQKIFRCSRSLQTKEAEMHWTLTEVFEVSIIISKKIITSYVARVFYFVTLEQVEGIFVGSVFFKRLSMIFLSLASFMPLVSFYTPRKHQ